MLFGEVPRAWRYQMMFAIQYRQLEQRHWLAGTTQNVSASGVLFGEAARDEWLYLDAPIEMEMIIRSDLVSGGATRIFCVGRVSRIVEPDIASSPRIVAATIARYRFLRGNAGATM